MNAGHLERAMRHRLDGTFTRVGGRRFTVPRDFIPSHQDAQGAAGAAAVNGVVPAAAIVSDGRERPAGRHRDYEEWQEKRWIKLLMAMA